MLNASEREKRLAWIAGAAAALLLLDQAWLRPLMARWGETSDAIAAARARLERSRSLIDHEDMIRRQWRKTFEAVSKAEAAMSFQSYLNAVERRAGVVEKNRKTLPPSKERGRVVERYALALNGSLRSVVAFLNELLASPRLLRITQLSFRSRDKSDRLDVDVVAATMRVSSTKSKEKKR